MIRNILFDLDNTLFDFDKAEALAVRRTLLELGVDPTPAVVARYSQLNLAQWKLLELGKLTRQEVKLRRYQLLFEELGIRQDPRKAARIYETQLGIGHYFIEGAKELLQELHGTTASIWSPMALLRTEKPAASSGIQPYFQGIFISEELGADKPNAAYFDACFARIPDFQKEESVIVGDSLTSDIKGGLNAGIRTIWFHPSSAANETGIQPDYELHALKDLPQLLTRI